MVHRKVMYTFFVHNSSCELIHCFRYHILIKFFFRLESCTDPYYVLCLAPQSLAPGSEVFIFLMRPFVLNGEKGADGG